MNIYSSIERITGYTYDAQRKLLVNHNPIDDSENLDHLLYVRTGRPAAGFQCVKVGDKFKFVPRSIATTFHLEVCDTWLRQLTGRIKMTLNPDDYHSIYVQGVEVLVSKAKDQKETMWPLPFMRVDFMGERDSFHSQVFSKKTSFCGVKYHKDYLPFTVKYGSVNSYKKGFLDHAKDLEFEELYNEGLIDVNTHTFNFHVHECKTIWSSFTGFLKEHLMPWKWKVAHLHLGLENFQKGPRRLISVKLDQPTLTSPQGFVKTFFPKVIATIMGKSEFEAALCSKGHCLGKEMDGRKIRTEYLMCTLKVAEAQKMHSINNSAFFNSGTTRSDKKIMHVFRARNVFSFFGYQLLKFGSKNWKEVGLYVKGVTEKVLVQVKDEIDLPMMLS